MLPLFVPAHTDGTGEAVWLMTYVFTMVKLLTILPIPSSARASICLSTGLISLPKEGPLGASSVRRLGGDLLAFNVSCL